MKMTDSKLRWHLARDNQVKLARFCQNNGIVTATTLHKHTFNITYIFDNGGYIEVELLRGTENKSYSVADHFQVVNYGWGVNTDD